MYLGRYVNEFTFRLNEGNVRIRNVDRIARSTDAAVGKRILYKLIAE